MCVAYSKNKTKLEQWFKHLGDPPSLSCIPPLLNYNNIQKLRHLKQEEKNRINVYFGWTC